VSATDRPPARLDRARSICAILSLLLLSHGLLLLAGTHPLPFSRTDSPWPYLALGALLAVRALVSRPPSA
jgi:hypothetical protein